MKSKLSRALGVLLFFGVLFCILYRVYAQVPADHFGMAPPGQTPGEVTIRIAGNAMEVVSDGSRIQQANHFQQGKVVVRYNLYPGPAEPVKK